MVSSYYNPLAYQKHTGSYPPSNHGWFPPTNYPTGQHNFLNDVDAVHHQAITQYYTQHHPMFHQPGEWHTADNMQTSPNSHAHHMFQHQGSLVPGQTQLNESTSTNGDNNNPNNPNSHQTTNLSEALPSPPITVSGSELSSPGGAPIAASSPNGNMTVKNFEIGTNGRVSPAAKAHYYDWMKKPTYPAQPTPGKTRTKDKYRVVYSDYQRLELEKEYCTSRYITIRRKSELASTLQLSERQVKIWFQNRRAKERKQQKKRDDPVSAMVGSEYMDTKPKLDSNTHLLHMVSSMGMTHMGLHPGLHHHHHHTALLQQNPQHLHAIHPQMPGSVPTPPM